MEIFEFEQNSPEWYAARLGIVTASKLKCVIAKGRTLGVNGDPVSRTRQKYMRQLAGEIVTGEPMDSFRSADMDRGKDMEHAARLLYSMNNNVDVTQVGFIKDGRVGCSPDGLVGNDGMLEIKSAFPDIIIEAMLANKMPPEHRAQTQGNLWVAQREWIDLQMYWPGMPFVAFRQYRDKPYIRGLAEAVAEFNTELDEMCARVRAFAPYMKASERDIDYGIAPNDIVGKGFMV